MHVGRPLSSALNRQHPSRIAYRVSWRIFRHLASFCEAYVVNFEKWGVFAIPYVIGAGSALQINKLSTWRQ